MLEFQQKSRLQLSPKCFARFVTQKWALCEMHLKDSKNVMVNDPRLSEHWKYTSVQLFILKMCYASLANHYQQILKHLFHSWLTYHLQTPC